MASTLQEQISVQERGVDEFVSVANPGRMGNANNIGYGGCTLSIAIQAACQTVSPQYILYSAMGNYVGPASTDHKLQCSVRRLRDTRTFATRFVEVRQELGGGGQTRLCMTVLADFQVQEKDSLLVFSAPPTQPYSPPERSPTVQEAAEGLVRAGAVSAGLTELFLKEFGLMYRFFESRGAPEGVMSNNLSGLLKTAKTAQDGRALPSKTSADWFRCHHPLESKPDHYAGLGFILDGGLSFMPLAHSGRFLDDAGACSSLDFALRVFTADLDLASWHLREMKTLTGGDGRTFSESRLWDEAGNMVAHMTQQCILRPPKEKPDRAAL